MDAMLIFIWIWHIWITKSMAFFISFIIMLFVKPKKMKMYLSITAICFCCLWIHLLYFAFHPIIICSNQLKPTFTKEMRNGIRRYGDSGFYSRDYPAFPLYIKVLSIEGNIIHFETKYSTLGTKTMELDDGLPSVVRPLFGI